MLSKRKHRVWPAIFFLAILISTARAIPVITTDASGSKRSATPLENPAFQTLTTNQDGSFLSRTQERVPATDGNVNTLIGLDTAGTPHRGGIPGASVFVGSTSATPREPPTGNAASKPAPKRAPSALKPDWPSASVFLKSAPDMISLLPLPAASSPNPQASITIFRVGDRSVTLPLAAIGAPGALESSLTAFVGASETSTDATR